MVIVHNIMIKKNAGFTLIELLVVIAIIVLLMAISVFGLAGARESARDQRRKSDIETVRSALEIYRADCDAYPPNSGTGSFTFGGAMNGKNASGKCLTSYTYMQKVPTDPGGGTYKYSQTGGGTGYEICSTLEKPSGGSPTVSCGGSTSCGSVSCYYKAVNP
jgi:general secretion pathway protein G